MIFYSVNNVARAQVQVQQQSAASSNNNLTKIIEDRFGTTNCDASELAAHKGLGEAIASTPCTTEPHVNVISGSAKTIVLFGHLITSPYRTDNSDLWKAADLLKINYGFKLTHIVHEGEGSEGNPGRVYIIMEHQ